MRIFPPALEIGDDEGFTPEKDIFQRASLGEGLTNLVSVAEDPLVIALDAPWGSGKTTFIKMWAGELRKKNFPVIYFDAFANDSSDDAFVVLAAEVIGLSAQMKNEASPTHKKFLKKAARAGGILLRTGTKIGVKAATLGALDVADFDALKSIASDVANETSTKADQYLESILKLQSQEKESLQQLRDALGELAKSLPNRVKPTESNAERPLVFIIDELDRCRPTFALELLEKVKHIFSISSVHFVLVTHMTQLEHAVSYAYGNEIDSKGYLQKFFSLITNLPHNGRYRHERETSKYVSYLAKKLNISHDELEIVASVAAARDLPLRTIERIATNINIARQFTPSNFLWLHPIVAGLCIMKTLDNGMFRRARQRQATIEEVKRLLGISSWPEDASSKEFVMDWWTFCLAENESDHPNLDWKGLKSSLFRYHISDRQNIVEVMASHIERFKLPTS